MTSSNVVYWFVFNHTNHKLIAPALTSNLSILLMCFRRGCEVSVYLIYFIMYAVEMSLASIKFEGTNECVDEDFLCGAHISTVTSKNECWMRDPLSQRRKASTKGRQIKTCNAHRVEKSDSKFNKRRNHKNKHNYSYTVWLIYIELFKRHISIMTFAWWHENYPWTGHPSACMRWVCSRRNNLGMPLLQEIN